MTKEQFLNAMAIIGTGGACTVKTKNDAGLFGDKETAKFSVALIDCCHNVVKHLHRAGFITGMSQGELTLTFLGNNRS